MKIPFGKRRHLPFGKEYKHLRILRILHLIAIGVFAFGVVEAAIFLYERVYESIERAEGIVFLRSEIGAEVIDFNQLERVKAAWQLKHATTTVSLVRDPFVTPPTGGATATSTLDSP
jgi:hypothetical protein